MSSEETLYFYDLETSGLSPSGSRIMQFGGVRTDLNLNIIGEPLLSYIKFPEDTLPSPEAILVTKITPQKANEEGYSEPEFIEQFTKHAIKPGTIFTGYNTIRFDDEFMRHLLWRNLRDPYQWQWKDNASRIDMIDIVRMTRALRPDDIKWPIDKDGVPINNLDKLTVENNIEHSGAHDAMADVIATIEVMKLIKAKQPKIYDYLIANRFKKSAIEKLKLNDDLIPFVHTSSQISPDYLSTSVFVTIGDISGRANSFIAYDLRTNPVDLADKTVEDIASTLNLSWKELEAQSLSRPPLKGIHANKSPALSPLGVMDELSLARIKLSLQNIEKNRRTLKSDNALRKKLVDSFNLAEKLRAEKYSSQDLVKSAEASIYDGFVDDNDSDALRDIIYSLKNGVPAKKYVNDKRLDKLVSRYKARNYPDMLDDKEKLDYDTYKENRLNEGESGSPSLSEFMTKIAQLKQSTKNKEELFILEELQLFGESLI